MKESKTFWRNVKKYAGLGRLKQFVNPWPCASVKQATMSATKLNQQFVDSVTRLKSTVPSTHSVKISQVNPSSSENLSEVFISTKITISEVRRAISDLSLEPSHGEDGIMSRIIWQSSDAIAPRLAALFNTSLNEGIFLDTWKTVIVTPVLKKDDIYDMNNYRPVSLLNLISKVFEKIVCRQLTKYLKRRELLSSSQHGFRRKRSCESALMRLSNLLFTSRRNKRHILLVTIDFSKAFDCLNFDRLLSEFKKCGINGGKALLWFRSYLTGRKQRTKYCNALSPALPITSGVPEGSILGPVLFNVYINSLLISLPSDWNITYVDDVTLVASDDLLTSANSTLQSMLQMVFDWSLQYGLAVSPSKYYVMYISPDVRPGVINLKLSFSLDSASLPTVTSLRILGVIFIDNLNWSAQYDVVRKKIVSMSSVIHRFVTYLTLTVEKRWFMHLFYLTYDTACLSGVILRQGFSRKWIHRFSV